MTKTKFVNILYLPPPDCLRCTRPTVWLCTPTRFRPADSRVYSGCRGLCLACYDYLRTHDPDGLLDFPTVKRRCTDIYAEYVQFKQIYPRWTKRQIATELIGIKHTTLCQAITRARRLERKKAA